ISIVESVLGGSKHRDAVNMKMLIIGLSTIMVLLLLEVYFLMSGVYAALELNSPISIFWLEIHSVPVRLSLTCLIIPVSTVLVIFTIRRRKNLNFGFFAVILFITILTNVVGFWALPSGILRQTKQQDSLNIEERIYQVAHSYSDVGDAHPYL